MSFWLFPLGHLLAVMSPGPDFFLILNHSLLHSRRGSLISAFGIACGCLIHMGTVILVIFFLGNRIEWMSQVLKFLGSGYLAFLGITSLREFFHGFSRKHNPSPYPQKEKEESSHLDKKNSSRSGSEMNKKIHDFSFTTYFLKGFLCNLLNPKAWAYFTSIFMIVTIEFSLLEIGILVFIFYVITQAWFSLVTVLFTLPKLQHKFNQYRWVMSLLCGIAFNILAISLIWNL